MTIYANIAHYLQPQILNSTLENIWHLFVIRHPQRDKLQQFLSANGIQTLIHYPIPPHKQRAYKYLNNIKPPVTEKIHHEALSLPMSPVLKNEEAAKVVSSLNHSKI